MRSREKNWSKDLVKNTKYLTLVAVFTSISLVLYYIEMLLPGLDFVAPGVKLGLANIIVLSLLIVYGFKTAFIVFMLRVTLSSFFAAGLSTWLYSFAGGLLSLLIMYVLTKPKKLSFSVIGISVAGSFAFNIGQLFTASVTLGSFKIFYYLPAITVLSLATGVFIGVVSGFLVLRGKSFLNKDMI